MGDARIIGIIGTPYCGSTMLARLLGALRGVSSPGELCHLALTSKVRNGFRIRKPESGSWPVACARCKYKCPIFPKEYILKDHKPMEVYQDVAKRLGDPIMVVADKSPAHFEASIKPGLMDGIVLFKCPEAAVFSLVKRRQDAGKAMKNWSNRYGKALSWADGFCKTVVFASYEELARAPTAALSILSRELELPAVHHGFSWLRAHTYHYLGGNGGTHTRNQVQVDIAWQRGLREPLLRKVQANEQMQTIYERMMERRLRFDGTGAAS